MPAAVSQDTMLALSFSYALLRSNEVWMSAQSVHRIFMNKPHILARIGREVDNSGVRIESKGGLVAEVHFYLHVATIGSVKCENTSEIMQPLPQSSTNNVFPETFLHCPMLVQQLLVSAFHSNFDALVSSCFHLLRAKHFCFEASMHVLADDDYSMCS